MPSVDPLNATVHTIMKDIGRVWAGMGAPDTSVDFQGFSAHSPDAPTCNGQSVWGTEVCFTDRRPLINWERTQLAEVTEQGGDLAVAILLAREYGRIMLFSYGEPVDGAMAALRVECFAGVYTAASAGTYTADAAKAYETVTKGEFQVPFNTRRTAAFETGKATATTDNPFKSCMDAGL